MKARKSIATPQGPWPLSPYRRGGRRRISYEWRLERVLRQASHFASCDNYSSHSDISYEWRLERVLRHYDRGFFCLCHFHFSPHLLRMKARKSIATIAVFFVIFVFIFPPSLTNEGSKEYCDIIMIVVFFVIFIFYLISYEWRLERVLRQKLPSPQTHILRGTASLTNEGSKEYCDQAKPHRFF